MRVPVPRCEIDGKTAAEGSDPIGQVLEPGSRAGPPGNEPDPGVLDDERDARRAAAQPDPDDRVRAAVLEAVLEGLDAGVVDGPLDLGRVAVEPVGIDRDGKRRLGGNRAQRLRDAEAGERPRSTVAGHAPDVRERVLEAAPELVDRGAIVVRCRSLGQQAELDAEADQALLGAVVQIALDAPALEVRCVEGADARLAQVTLQGCGSPKGPDRAAQRQGQEQDRRRGGCLQDRHSEEHAERDQDAQQHHTHRPGGNHSGGHPECTEARLELSRRAHDRSPSWSPCEFARPKTGAVPRDTRPGVLRWPGWPSSHG